MANIVNINIFDPRELTEAINAANIFEPFLLTALFGDKQFSESDTIDKMTYKYEQGVSEAVSKDAVVPNLIENGKAVHGTVTLPRFWDKKVFNATELDNMLVPTGYLDSSAREAQAALNRLREVDDMKRRIFRAAEKLAASLLLSGTGSTGNYSFNMNFPANTIEDISADAARKWDGGSAINILYDIESKQDKVVGLTGLPVDFIVMGTTAWQYCSSNTAFMTALDTNNNRIGAIDRTIPPQVGGSFKGKILGCELYVYDQKYGAKSGKSYTSTAIFDPTKVLFVARQSKGFVHHFASIKEVDATGSGKVNKIPVEYLLTPIVGEDKKSLQWNIESVNLPAIWQPEALAVMKVVA